MTTSEVFEKLLKNNNTLEITFGLELRQVSDFLDGYCCAIGRVENLADKVAVAIMLDTAFKYAQTIDKNVKRKEHRQKYFEELKEKLEK